MKEIDNVEEVNKRVTIDELSNLFQIVLDIGIIREQVGNKDGFIKITNTELEEFIVFINVYVHMLSIGIATEEHKDIFSMGISSLKFKHVKKIINSIVLKIKEEYENLIEDDKVEFIILLVEYSKNSKVGDLDKYIDLQEVVGIIKEVKYEKDTSALKKNILNKIRDNV